MNINQLDELKAALTLMEGNGACWDDPRGGDCTLQHAIDKYNEFATYPDSEKEGLSAWYECVYGNGGWHRYFVNMLTGEVTFSAYHSRKERIEQAVILGFKLH